MPTYALLGATGATGSSVLCHLLQTQPADLVINVLVRSKPKLLQAFPGLLESPSSQPQVHVVQGDCTDNAALDECLRSASVVFMCVAQNSSAAGTSICADTAAAVIDALRRRRRAEGRRRYQPCTAIQLRSASLNSVLAAQVPRAVHALVCFCLSAAYADLRRACEHHYPRAHREDLLRYVLVDPPTLHDARGATRTGHRLILAEAQSTALSYADLGAALCEVAERGAEFQSRAVGVTATGHVRQNWAVLVGYLIDGGMRHLVYTLWTERARMVVVVVCVVAVVVGLYRM
jgi:hypothetical protein